MQIYEIILIGLALSIDACALTIANCTTYKDCLSKKQEWSMPIAFAIFQGIMPLIGFYISSLFSSLFSKVADFLTAGIFFALAIKIILDIIKDYRAEKVISTNKACPVKSRLSFLVLMLQALATSIDALVIVVTFINLSFSIFKAVALISAVTFLMVTIAFLFGKKLGNLFGSYAEWLGAGILVFLAIKSLIQALL